MRRIFPVLVVTLSALSLACGSAARSTVDKSGTALDLDSGRLSGDAGTAVSDGGLVFGGDAGTPPDGGVQPLPPLDGGTAANLCPNMTFANCATFTDGTASAAATIQFGVPGFAFAFTPNCLKVKAGTKVTFSGAFSHHPFRSACGPSEAITSQDTGTSATFTLAQPGLYGYYCDLHGDVTGAGMAGAIEVVP